MHGIQLPAKHRLRAASPPLQRLTQARTASARPQAVAGAPGDASTSTPRRGPADRPGRRHAAAREGPRGALGGSLRRRGAERRASSPAARAPSPAPAADSSAAPGYPLSRNATTSSALMVGTAPPCGRGPAPASSSHPMSLQRPSDARARERLAGLAREHAVKVRVLLTALNACLLLSQMQAQVCNPQRREVGRRCPAADCPRASQP